FGDPVADCAQYLLAMAAPYAGDELYANKDQTDHLARFYVYQISGTEHIVIDHAYLYSDNKNCEFKIPSTWLESRNFNIVQWYTLKQSKLNSYEFPDQYNPKRKWMAHSPMGNTYGTAIECLLD
ncbi:hypothetical protein GYMLUDRAFT_117633, partial [Collybiopsis luxurians FD-317 M1]